MKKGYYVVQIEGCNAFASKDQHLARQLGGVEGMANVAGLSRVFGKRYGRWVRKLVDRHYIEANAQGTFEVADGLPRNSIRVKAPL